MSLTEMPRDENAIAHLDDISEVDPALSEHVIAIRDRFGVDGLRDAQRLIEIEIALFKDAYDELDTI